MFSRRAFLKVHLFFVILSVFAGTAQAKSLYVINNTNTSQLRAYKITGTSLVYQTDYNCVSAHGVGEGAVGVAIDESDYGDFLFVTFENTNQIELVDAKMMKYVNTVTATSASNLAGIVVDEGNSKIYVMQRYSNYLYSYSWDRSGKTLTLDFPYPYYVQLQDCYQSFGIALDEKNSRLYVGDNTKKIKYYNTNNWSKVGEVNVSCNVISVALDVNNQFLYYGSMGYYGQGDPNLYQYNIFTHDEDDVNVGCSVAGIVYDQSKQKVYKVGDIFI